MSRVLCFGEILLRMSPSADHSWIANRSIPVYIGGAELNVATALARWNLPVSYCTAVPDNSLSAGLIQYISENGIGTEAIIKSGNRVGLYYLQQGTDLKHAAVIYDRAHSSFSGLKPGMVDWDRTLHNVSLFHFSAISPALNNDVAAVCLEAVEHANRRNITVSIDLNYRASLWRDGRDPVKVISPLVEHCSIVMGNIWSAETLLGIPVQPDIHTGDQHTRYRSNARKTALVIEKKFPLCRSVCQTFRFDRPGGGISYFTTMDNATMQYESSVYESSAIVDKVGSGDCFMAGLLYGFMTGREPQSTLDLATKAAFLKMHEMGDATSNTIQAIESRELASPE